MPDSAPAPTDAAIDPLHDPDGRYPGGQLPRLREIMRRLRDMRRRLVELTEELHVANQHLNEMVEMDPLTGLVNRRGFDRILHSEILAARRDGVPLTLMLCDLDHFKRYNDTLGHVQGDACLKEVGRVLHDVLLVQAKAPEESIGPWDTYRILARITGAEAYRPPGQSECPLLRR